MAHLPRMDFKWTKRRQAHADFPAAAPLLLIAALGVLTAPPLAPEIRQGALLLAAVLLLECHTALSRSTIGRILAGATLGLGVSTLGIMLAVYKCGVSAFPGPAKALVRWAALAATILGIGNAGFYTEGFWQSADLLLSRTRFYVVTLWEYHLVPTPGTVLTLSGVTVALPVGKIFFISSMTAGVLLTFYMHWFEARSCQACGDNLVDIECDNCLRAREEPRVCNACHCTQDPWDRHVNARRVSRVGQRLLSGVLLLAGACLLLFPDCSGRRVAALLLLLAVSKGRELEKQLRLARGSKTPCRERRTESPLEVSTRLEREMLRELWHKHAPGWGLSANTLWEVSRVMDSEDYLLLPKG